MVLGSKLPPLIEANRVRCKQLAIPIRLPRLKQSININGVLLARDFFQMGVNGVMAITANG